MDISPDITMIDTILSGMIQSPTFDHSETDTKFTACVIRDAVSLPDTESEYARRKHMFYSVLIGGHGEVWKVGKASLPDDVDALLRRKEWNEMDLRFRVLGGKKGGGAMDKFLESKGWNDVDSGFGYCEGMWW